MGMIREIPLTIQKKMGIGAFGPLFKRAPFRIDEIWTSHKMLLLRRDFFELLSFLKFEV